MIRRIMVLLVLCVVTLLPAFAQQQKPSKSYVLKAARLFDGKSNAGSEIANASIALPRRGPALAEGQ